VKVYLKRKGSMLYSKSDYVGTKYDLGYSTDWDKQDESTIDIEHYECGVRAYEHRRPTPAATCSTWTSMSSTTHRLRRPPASGVREAP